MKIKPGKLVKLDFKKTISPENLTLTSTEGSSVVLYEKISLESFPSWKDFLGYKKSFNKEIFLVVSNKGRPSSFNKEKHWNIYDVYQLLYENKIYECFSYCLSIVDDYEL